MGKKQSVSYLKIYYKTIRSKGFRPIYKSTPWISLNGVWLRNEGFEIGKMLCVEVYKRKLIIEVVGE